MAAEEEGFLHRWSRRKQEAARPAEPPSAREDAAATEATEAEAKRKAAEEEERAAILARLPRIEDLTAASDVRPFMHPLVPAALRGAALARLWTLDPAIRDFVGPARDYAWDWNAPGGVPGGGPAPEPAEVENALRRIMARLDSEAAESDPPARAPASPAEAPPEASAASDQAAAPPGEKRDAAPDRPKT